MIFKRAWQARFLRHALSHKTKNHRGVSIPGSSLLCPSVLLIEDEKMYFKLVVPNTWRRQKPEIGYSVVLRPEIKSINVPLSSFKFLSIYYCFSVFLSLPQQSFLFLSIPYHFLASLRIAVPCSPLHFLAFLWVP